MVIIMYKNIFEGSVSLRVMAYSLNVMRDCKYFFYKESLLDFLDF